MARKNYTDEFRQRAVDLYEFTPSATVKGIAGDLGISRGALKEWVDKFGSGVTVAAASPPGATGRPESQAAKVLRLEAELAASHAWRDLRFARGRFVLIGSVVALITLLVGFLAGLTGGLAAQNVPAGPASVSVVSATIKLVLG